MLRRVLPWLAFAVLVGVAVASAGWGATGSRTPDPARPSGSPSEPSLSTDAARRLVHRVHLVRQDLPAGFTHDPVGPAAALDLCAAPYPSDGLRLATHTDAFTGPDGRRVRTRVIAYEPGAADRAVDELRRAAPACTRAVRPSTAEQPSTLALRVRSTGSLNRAARHELVVERRGDVLVLLDTDRASAARVLDLARLLSRRLIAQLPDD